MSNEFLVWVASYQMEQGFCHLTKFQGFKKTWLLLEGAALAGQWPALVTFSMDPRYPKATALLDVHFGDANLVSSRAKDSLTQLVGDSRLEFLPVTILNHKGRVASKDYFIVNPLDVIDCIDVKKSGVVWNAIDPSMISSVKKLVLNESSVPKGISLFRPKSWRHTVLVRRPLAEALSAAGLTGLCFLKSSEYTR